MRKSHVVAQTPGHRHRAGRGVTALCDIQISSNFLSSDWCGGSIGNNEAGTLTYCAVGGKVRLDGGRVVLREALVVAGRDLERRPLGAEAEVDHRPAAEEKE